ncbi:MAG: hypothetical protein RLZZ490_73 [Cyanobacteriota bacterium]
MFFASSVFLKTPERVAALARVMGLCLLVYTLASEKITPSFRQSEANHSQSVGQPHGYPHHGLGVSVVPVHSFGRS